MRHVQIIRQNSLASAMANLLLLQFSTTVWEQLTRISIATSWILNSFLVVLGQPVCSSYSQLSLPCAKRLCHLNTAVLPKASSPYYCLII
jgi:hypothetical protein